MILCPPLIKFKVLQQSGKKIIKRKMWWNERGENIQRTRGTAGEGGTENGKINIS